MSTLSGLSERYASASEDLASRLVGSWAKTQRYSAICAATPTNCCEAVNRRRVDHVPVRLAHVDLHVVGRQSLQAFQRNRRVLRIGADVLPGIFR